MRHRIAPLGVFAVLALLIAGANLCAAGCVAGSASSGSQSGNPCCPHRDHGGKPAPHPSGKSCFMLSSDPLELDDDSAAEDPGVDASVPCSCPRSIWVHIAGPGRAQLPHGPLSLPAGTNLFLLDQSFRC